MQGPHGVSLVLRAPGEPARRLFQKPSPNIGFAAEPCSASPSDPCRTGAPPASTVRPIFAHCEGVVGHRVVTGTYGSLTLDGLKWVLVVRWPGAIHERNGRGVVFLDVNARGSKREALEAIATGRAGGPIGIFMSTVNAGLEVREAKIDFKLHGEKSFVRVADVVDVALEPILNPVTKAPHYARAVFKTGLLTDAEDYFSNKVATAKVAGLTMDHAGKNAHTYLSNWKGP